MPKHIHVHLGPAPTRDSDGEGRWVTINGAHVHIGEGGKIDKGPAALTGKTEHEAHSHTHNEAGNAHADAAKAKGEKHPDYKYHMAAAREHWHAGAKFAGAGHAAERGDVKHAKKVHEEAQSHARMAAEQERTLAQPSSPPGGGKEPPAFQKPKAHVALHSEAEDDVKGSEKHEAEHKRLMKLYDSASQPWERNAANRQIQRNQTDAVQHKAQAQHHAALAASEHAKRTGSADDHRNASEHLQKAIDAHGRAGGVGYAAKQAELAKAKKGHDAEVAKADKVAGGSRGAGASKAGDPYERGTDHGTLEAAHRHTAKALHQMGQKSDAQKHEQAADAHAKAASSGDAQHSKDAHYWTKQAGAPMKPPAVKVNHDDMGEHDTEGAARADMDARGADLEARGYKRGREQSADGRRAVHYGHADGSKAVLIHDTPERAGSRKHWTSSTITPPKDATPGSKKKSGGRAGGGSGMDRIAERAAKRAAEKAADNDPKHQK